MQLQVEVVCLNRLHMAVTPCIPSVYFRLTNLIRLLSQRGHSKITLYDQGEGELGTCVGTKGEQAHN